MDISSLMQMVTAKPVLQQMEKSVNADKTQLTKLIELGLPTIMQAMGKNTESKTGAASLFKALQQHQDDDLGGMVKNVAGINTNDGKKMLGYIFADKSSTVNANLARETGLSLSQVSAGLSTLAPMVMGFLGQEQKKQNVNAGGLGGLLTGMLASGGKNSAMNIAGVLLDKNKDGSIVDDIGGMLGGFLKKR